MHGDILVIDGCLSSRILLKVKLAAASWRVETADGLDSGLAQIARLEPSLVLIASDLQADDPVGLCQRLRAALGENAAGILMLDRSFGSLPRAEVLAAGVDDVIAEGLRESSLLALVRSMMRRHATGGSSRRQAPGLVPDAPDAFALTTSALVAAAEVGMIVVLEDTQGSGHRLAALLAGHLRERVVATTEKALLAKLVPGSAPDVILLRAGRGDPTPLYALSDLKSRMLTRHCAVLVMTDDDDDLAAAARDMGADDIIPEGSAPMEIAVRIRMQLARKKAEDARRQSLEDELRLAAYDPLTGLLNRRAGLLALEQALRVSAAEDRPMSILTLDIDRFKTINDQFGHGGGDQILAQFGKRITRSLRATDVCARMGGEEFLVGLPGASGAAAVQVAQRLRKAIASQPFVLADGVAVSVTASIGIAVGGEGGNLKPELDALVEQSDRALYASKAAGRNRVRSAHAA